jgi:hypothetical protein
MPNQLRQNAKTMLGLPKEATDLQLFQKILKNEPENISAMCQTQKLTEAGKEWMDAKGNPAD